MPNNVDLGEFGTGSVDRLRLTITKDGIPWSGIDSVVVTFEKPDRSTRFSHSAVLENDLQGTWYLDTVASEMATTGFWTVGFVVTDGTVVKKWPYQVTMEYKDQP